MDTKKYVDCFRKTIIEYGIPNNQIVTEVGDND